MTDDITSVAALEDRIGKAPAIVHLKTIDHLDQGARDWIAASPLMFATFGNTSNVGGTIGGNELGWATTTTHELRLPTSWLDDPTLAQPGVGFGSIFLIPSLSEILRVNGQVTDVEKDEIQISVEECYLHCGKPLIRSGFWSAIPEEAAQDASTFALQSRFLALSTVDTKGRADLSPKGDPAGAMACFRDGTLWFADRPGNKRIDSFRNIVTQSNVAATLLIPGSTQVLSLSGTARITEDEDIRSYFTVQGKTPALLIGIAPRSSALEESAALNRVYPWPAPAVPAHISSSKIGVEHIRLNKSAEAQKIAELLSQPNLLEQKMAQDYQDNLY
ncbi:pyridoxamine 5-phosphate oxidase [bacterium]|nr:MAG: pyridoxamine 5-phosphate oxidase [bacterium]